MLVRRLVRLLSKKKTLETGFGFTSFLILSALMTVMITLNDPLEILNCYSLTWK